ncbi:MAG: Mur ligase family protein [Microgenomates group bacterium]
MSIQNIKMKFNSIKEIELYLQKFIPSSTQIRFPGEEGILRTKEFLKLLGSPQNEIPCIHIAGTSGKGSTSFMISSFLYSLGFKVGLHLSPHLLDIRERALINNLLIDEKRYIHYFEELVPMIEKMRNSSFGMITYFEVLVGLTYYIFAKERVDYMVVEVGLGGKYDGTNIIDRPDKLSVISKIGLDHVQVLGNTPAKIAHQKAMICMEKGSVISIFQTPSVEKVIKSIAEEKKAKLSLIERKDIKNRLLTNGKTQFTLMWDGVTYKNIVIGLFGLHQAENAALAIASMLYLGKRDHFRVDMAKIRTCAELLRFKGRMDILTQKNKKIIIDGAHNEQKMKAFLKALAAIEENKKYTFVIAFKKGKDYKKMLRFIIPFARKIVITTIFSEHQDLFHFSTDPKIIKDELTHLGFTNISIIEKIKKVKNFIYECKTDVVVTGSLYLLGDLYTLLND